MYYDAIMFGFKLFVDKTFPKETIRNYLKNHERVPLLVESLAGELKSVETIVVKSNKTQLERRTLIKNLINDFSRMFCRAALEELIEKKKLKEVPNEDTM